MIKAHRADSDVELMFLEVVERIYNAYLARLTKTGEVPAMPPADVAFPGGDEGRQLVDSVRDWIFALPNDLAQLRIKKTAMKESRKIRSQAGIGGKDCGQMGPGDVVYIDPRSEAQIKKDGWLWNKIYLLPEHPRLLKNACAYPVDGVFYMAVTKL